MKTMTFWKAKCPRVTQWLALPRTPLTPTFEVLPVVWAPLLCCLCQTNLRSSQGSVIELRCSPQGTVPHHWSRIELVYASCPASMLDFSQHEGPQVVCVCSLLPVDIRKDWVSCAIFHSEQSNLCLQPSNCWLHATSASPGRWPSDRFLFVRPTITWLCWFCFGDISSRISTACEYF